MSSAETILAVQGDTLLQVACDSIRHGLRTGRPLQVNPAHYPPELQAPGATFCTLKSHGELRGCIGRIEAERPLVEDVAENAFAAAFEDPRFPPVRAEELPDLTLSLALLDHPVPMRFTDEADLLRQVRPGIDGLILSAGGRRALFLPAVWESLPDPEAFLGHLKRKAGLPWDWWSPRAEVARFGTTDTKSVPVGPLPG